MATALQRFRRRHPEFSELSDFEIADGLRRKLERENDEPVLIRPFFEAIGGPELKTELTPSEEPAPTPPPAQGLPPVTAGGAARRPLQLPPEGFALTGEQLQPAIEGGQALEQAARFARGEPAPLPDERVARRRFRDKEAIAQRTREILGDAEKETATQAKDRREAFASSPLGPDTALGQASSQVMNLIPMALGLFAAQNTNNPEVLKTVVESFGRFDQDPVEAAGRRGRSIASGALGASAGIIGFLGLKTNIEALQRGALTAQGIAEGLMPRDPAFIEELGSGFGSTAVFWLPGVGIAKGAGAIGKVSTTLALWAGAGASGVMEAAAEAGGLFQSLIDQGIDPKEAERRADESFNLNSGVVALMNRFGFFGEQASQFARVTLTAASEGVQEFFQKVVENLEETDPLLQGTGKATLIGAIIGKFSALATPRGVLPGEQTPAPEGADTFPTGGPGFQPPAPTAEEQAAIDADVSAPPVEAVPPTEPQGKTRTVFTPRGEGVEVEFGVTEVEDLVTSHDDAGNVNPDFPARLQPRDRDTKKSAVQIAKIAGNLNPELLGDSPNITDGAPIVKRMAKEDAQGNPVLDAQGKPIMQNVVISGNARVIAARQALRDQRGENYRAALPELARAAGIGTRDVNAQADPFLVRFLGEGVALEEFSRQANQPTTAVLSPAESARADAARLTTDDLSLFNPDQSGNPLAASNEQFIRKFLQAIGAEEAAGLIDDQGQGTKQLADRINSAIFARVYGDDRLIALQAQAADPQIRNILQALQAAAPAFARAKAIDEDLGGLNIPAKLTDAVEMIREQQRKGGTIEQLLEQSELFGERDAEAMGFARFIAANIRSAERMGRAFSTLADFLRTEMARQQTTDRFGDKAASLADLVAAANKEIDKQNAAENKATGGTIPDLFGANPTRLPTAPTPQPPPVPGGAEGKPTGQPGATAPTAAPAPVAPPLTPDNGEVNISAGSTLDLTKIKKSRIKLASKTYPGLVWVRFGDDIFATRVLVEPDPATNLHRSTGFIIEHAGHPTANFPYTLLTPSGERLVAETGRGWATLPPVEAKALSLFDQRAKAVPKQFPDELRAEEQKRRAKELDKLINRIFPPGSEGHTNLRKAVTETTNPLSLANLATAFAPEATFDASNRELGEAIQRVFTAPTLTKPSEAIPSAQPGPASATGLDDEIPTTVYRGEGRDDLESVYGPGVLRDSQGRPVPALGFGRYFAFTRAAAKKFGDTVATLSVRALRNPYIIGSDQQWRALVVNTLGWPFPNPAGSKGEDHLKNTDKLQEWMTANDHDAIIVTFPDTPADIVPGPPGQPERHIKTLRRLFAEPQVYIPGPAPPGGQINAEREQGAGAPNADVQLPGREDEGEGPRGEVPEPAGGAGVLPGRPAGEEPGGETRESIERSIAVLRAELKAAEIDLAQLVNDPELSKFEAQRLRKRAEEDMTAIRREITKLLVRAEKLPDVPGLRPQNEIVANLRDAQERIGFALADVSVPQAQREENAAKITVELRALQVELAQRALAAEPDLPTRRKARALDKARDAKASASLRKTADGLQRQIDNKLNPATAGQNMTPRRARIIDSMMADARHLQRIQSRLRAMADAIDAGSLPLILSGMRSKAIVEDLMRSTLPSGQNLEKEAKRAENAGLRTQAKWEEARAALMALETAGPTTDPIIEARREFDRLKRELVGVKGVGVDFFPTPNELAEQLVDHADAQIGDSVLEPSAGSGNIVEAMAEVYEGFPEIAVTALERSPQLVAVLKAQSRALADKHPVAVEAGDFLEYQGKHDVIVMNPPFSKNQDIAHVRHAWDILKPGGRLVAVMSEHAFIASGRAEKDFREWLDDNGGTADELEPGQLADRTVTQRSQVKGRIVEMNKPGAKAEPGVVAEERGTVYRIAEPAPNEPGAGPAAPGQLDLFAAEGKPQPKAPTTIPESEEKPRVKQIRTGTFHSAITHVDSIEDALHVLAPHRKAAQESFLALVTNADGKIIRIIRHSIGNVRGASVSTSVIAGSAAEQELGTTVDTDPGIVAGSIAETPGAHRVYFAHNHPSGSTRQSGADKLTTERLAGMLRGTGVRMMAGIVLAPGSTSASVLPVTSNGAVTAEVVVRIPPGRRRFPVPVTERRIRRVTKGEKIDSPEKARKLLRKQKGNGVMLLNNANQPLVFIQMSIDEMRELRSGDIATGASKLARAVVQHNAAAAMMITSVAEDGSLDAIRNVGTFLRDSQVIPIDGFLREADGTLTSLVERGMPLKKQKGQTFDQRDIPNSLDETDPEEASLELVRRIIIDAGGTVLLTEDVDGDLELDLVELPKKARGQGVGTRFMTQLVRHADIYGRDIALVPVKPGTFIPSGVPVATTAQDKLEKFYKLFGFAWDSTRTVMFRTTSAVVAPSTAPPRGTQFIESGGAFKGEIVESELPEPEPGAPKKAASGFGVLKTPIAPDRPLRREKILRQFERDLKLKIYVGRVKGSKSRLGFYRSLLEELRIRHNNDLETVAHEVGHFIDDVDGRFALAYRSDAYKAEVLGLSYDVEKLGEGFAEFMRLFLTQEEEAIARAPRFYDEFVRLIEGSQFEVALTRAQADMHAWFRQGAVNRALSKIGADKSFSGRVQDLWFTMEKIVTNPDDWVINESLDDLHGVKILERVLKGDIGDADLSPYKVMRLVRGVRGVVRAVFKQGTLGLQENGDVVFTGKGLRQVFEPVADVMDETMQYFAGRRAAELAGQRRENLLKPNEIDALIAQGASNPRIVQAFREYQAFLDRMMDFYQAAGIISPQSRTLIQELNKDYVPFHRILELATGERKTVNRAAFKRLFGGTANVDDIYNNIMQSVAALTDMAVKNMAKQKVYGLIKGSRGSAQFAARVPRDTKAVKIDSLQVAGKIKSILQDIGIDLAEVLPDGGMTFNEDFADAAGDFMKFFMFGQAPIGDDIDSVMFNGKRQYFQIADPMLLRAMLSFGFRPTSLLLRMLQFPKRVVTFGITALPDFFIPNLTRDSVSGWLLRRSNMIPFVDSIRGLGARLRSDDNYWLFLANGGGFASSVRSETATSRRELEKLYLNEGFKLSQIANTPARLIDMWIEVGSAFEYGTRLAEFKSSREQGTSLQEAAFRGREVSTDFAMRGASDFWQNFVSTVPFMNARLQGLYRLERELFERKGKNLRLGDHAGQLMARGFLGVTLPTLALWWINNDDDRYKALPDWIKDLHWVLLIPKRIAELLSIDEIYLIAKPFELGSLFASTPERAMQFIKDRDGKQFSDALGYIWTEQLGMNVIPQVASPIYDHVTNSNFTGGKVIPDDLANVDPSEQFRPWSSETSIFLGKTLGLSPLLFDNYVRGYLGTLGMYLTMGSDSLVQGGLPDGAAKEFADYPIVRRFTRALPLRRTAYEDEFYELREEIRQVTATFNKMRAEGRDPSEYITAKGRELLFGVRTTTDGVARTITRLNRTIRLVQLSGILSPTEKLAQIRELRRQRNKIFKDVADVLSPRIVRKLRERVEEER